MIGYSWKSGVPGWSRRNGHKIIGPLPGMEFLLIYGGDFMMGSEENENEKPVHKVTIRSFYLMSFSVTQEMWYKIMGYNPSYYTGDDLPVDKVSWYDCKYFIRRLNRISPGQKFRLPSEAEWEYACRAGTTTRYYSGNHSSDLDHAGWWMKNSVSRPAPVAQKTPNSWGLYDMHGNVWEWCEDWYHNNYKAAPADGSAWTSSRSGYRVLRGGSWGDPIENLRSASRRKCPPDVYYHTHGFRLVCYF